MTPHRSLALATIAAVTLLAGCSTTYDESLATSETVATTTSSSLPVGATTDLLSRMLDEVRGLSAKVAADEGDDAAAARIEQLWEAVRDDVTATAPDMVADFEFVLRRCRSAVDRHRPADADRAFKNLDLLVAAYPA